MSEQDRRRASIDPGMAAGRGTTRPAHGRAQQPTTALPLAWAWAFLIAYASLFPFEGWAVPQGLGARQLLVLPWPTWRDRFDEVANLLGYVPFGALICLTGIRHGRNSMRALMTAVVGALVLSYGVEVAQALVPSRVPSAKDTAFNVLGAASGAWAAAVLVHGGFVEPWQRMRDRWFDRRSPFAQTLLLLWPVALLVPTPVPLGLGHVRDEVMSLLSDAVSGTPLANDVELWIEAMQPVASDLSATFEATAVALGLIGPCVLSFALVRAPRPRAWLAAGALALAFSVTTLSTALSFGPEHALAWLTPRVGVGMLAGVVATALCLGLPMRAAAAVSMLALGSMALLINRSPGDPYYAQFLSTWERGRFVRFHGVAQWLAWIWPFAAIVWLLPRAVGVRR